MKLKNMNKLFGMSCIITILLTACSQDGAGSTVILKNGQSSEMSSASLEAMEEKHVQERISADDVQTNESGDLENEIDVISRFSSISWDEIESQNLSMNGGSMNMEGILCIGEIPEQQIKLYGYNDNEIQMKGVAIQIGENVNYFDWYYTTPKSLYPSVYWDDANTQLQISLKNYTGTGVAAEELHIMNQYETGTLEDCSFGLEEYKALLNQKIGFKFEEAGKSLQLINLDNDTVLSEILLPEVENEVENIELGNLSTFILGDSIILQVQAGYYQSGYKVAEYEGMPTLEFPIQIEWAEDQMKILLGEVQVQG